MRCGLNWSMIRIPQLSPFADISRNPRAVRHLYQEESDSFTVSGIL